ncbi:MAG: hypothetical protein GY754_01900, partial [bacterium]|nr:hypothetical protein [bacterium]
MPYDSFSFDKVKEILKLKIEEKLGIFAGIEEIEIPSSFIRELLEENVPLAL